MNVNIINVSYNIKIWYFAFNEQLELKPAKQKQLGRALVNFVSYLNYLFINQFVYIRDEEINVTTLTGI